MELEKQNSGVGSEDSKIMENNTTGSSSSNSDSKSKEITLYEWISSSDDRSTLDQLYEHCQRGLEQARSWFKIFLTVTLAIGIVSL